MKYDPHNPKISELKENISYILCPDDKCKLFWDNTQTIPCISNCPKLEERIVMIKCNNSMCTQRIYDLNIKDGKGFGWQRVDIAHKDGRICSHFPNSETFQIMYNMPK